MSYDLVAGDPGSKIRPTCRDDQTKAVMDLTGKTVSLRYKLNDGPLVIKPMAVLVPEMSGKAEYQFTASDLSAGTLQGEIQIQAGEPDQLTSLLPFSLRVRAPLS